MVPLSLSPLRGRFAVCRLPALAPLPAWLPAHGFTSCTRTASEFSVVCDESVVPADVRAERGFRALGVAGPLAFDQIGILASLTGALAAAGVSVFALSTFDTDYLLVPGARFDVAVAALRRAGHAVANDPAAP